MSLLKAEIDIKTKRFFPHFKNISCYFIYVYIIVYNMFVLQMDDGYC